MSTTALLGSSRQRLALGSSRSQSAQVSDYCFLHLHPYSIYRSMTSHVVLETTDDQLLHAKANLNGKPELCVSVPAASGCRQVQFHHVCILACWCYFFSVTHMNPYDGRTRCSELGCTGHHNSDLTLAAAVEVAWYSWPTSFSQMLMMLTTTNGPERLEEFTEKCRAASSDSRPASDFANFKIKFVAVNKGLQDVILSSSVWSARV